MENKFKVGDVVQLKGGGPVLTVTVTDWEKSHGLMEPYTCFCGWFDANHHWHTELLPVEALKAADSA